MTSGSSTVSAVRTSCSVTSGTTSRIRGRRGIPGDRGGALGRNHPAGVVLAALLFATLSQGALAVNAVVPKQLVEVLQAVIILAVAASVPEVRRAILASRARREA